MRRSEIFFIITSFFIWCFGILAIAFFALRFVPLFSHNYLGGGYSNYITNPLFLGHFNFDGEHYLSIARSGYKPLEYFFFPLFPMIMSFFSDAWGLIISNLIFLIALFGIYKLVKLDYKENIAKLVVILLLFFPTSFYFGTYYTESLFLSLIVLSFYFARKKNFLLASIAATFASATRVIGIVMLPTLLIEYFIDSKKNKYSVINALYILLISPLGLISYIYFLLKQTGDPLIFLHQISIFGQQRSSTLIILLQVIYRYVFEILPHVSYSYFPNVYTTYLEFGIGILFLILIIWGLFKLRISYSFYALFAYLIPTLAGSFSSMPRYVLALFPCFILVAIYLDKRSKFFKAAAFFVMLIFMTVSVALFWRGYWLS